MWNPTHDQQAQDRAYRIGQQRDVRVYRFISVGTIEENMYLRQIYKQVIFDFLCFSNLFISFVSLPVFFENKSEIADMVWWWRICNQELQVQVLTQSHINVVLLAHLLPYDPELVCVEGKLEQFNVYPGR